MATYVYECRECGYTFEVQQRMSEDPLTVCPECSGPIHRVVQAPTVMRGGSTPDRQESSGFS